MRYFLLFVTLLFSGFLFSQGFVQDNIYGFVIETPITADLNGDGLDDVSGIRFSYASDNTIVVALQEPGEEVNFTEKNIPINLDLTGRIDAGDMDGDGDIDLIVAENETLDIYLLRNSGTAGFTKKSLGISGSYFLKSIDIDNDGDLDIAGINVNTATLYTYLNNGNDEYVLDKTFDSNDDMAFIDVADMDNDGDTDIVITFEEFTGDQIILFENTGGGNFTEKVIGTSKFKSLNDVAIGDLNGDGFMDVFGVSNLSNQALLSNGDGTYESFEMPSPGGNLLSIEIADFTGEGRNDFVIANSNEISWFRNISLNPLVYLELSAGTVAPNFYFSKTDLSNDGDIDLIISNGEMWWLENTIEQEPNAIFTLDDQEIKIFPNPVSDYIYVEAENILDLRIEISDMQGRSLWNAPLTREAIDITSWSAGTYIVNVVNNKTRSNHNYLIIKE